MKFYLQFGHGMMGMTRALLSKNISCGAILSPRDLEEDQIISLGNDIVKSGGEVLLDPQCYLRSANHKRLTSHKYWKKFKDNSTGSILSGGGAINVLKALYKLSSDAKVQRHILPGLLATVVDDDWFHFHEAMIKSAASVYGNAPLLATIALSNKVMKDEAAVESIVERVKKWNVSGVYIVAESPNSYLVDDPEWIANLLILTSGLKLCDKYVLVGYSNHQSLCLAASNVDAIASGSWLNVRTFVSGKFNKADDDSISRRAKWYYCSRSLSEYKMNYLDIAKRNGVLDDLKPPSSFTPSFAAPLFTGATPSNIEWKEGEAFKHYLTCLHHQSRNATKSSFKETVSNYNSRLAKAKKYHKRLEQNGVLAGNRSFEDIFDVNKSAMITFVKARGHQLMHTWK